MTQDPSKRSTFMRTVILAHQQQEAVDVSHLPPNVDSSRVNVEWSLPSATRSAR